MSTSAPVSAPARSFSTWDHFATRVAARKGVTPKPNAEDVSAPAPEPASSITLGSAEEARSASGFARGKQLWLKARGVRMPAKVKMSVEEAERARRSKLVPFSRRYVLIRWTIGWIINIGIFVALWLINLMYGVYHGPPVMQSILVAWGAGLIQTFLIVEPSEVLGLVFLPSIAENKCVAWVKGNLKEYGFI